METGTSINYNSLQRMDGNDQVAMHEATRIWMKLASEQHGLLWRFYNLEEVFTVEDIPRVESAIMIIKQISDRVRSLELFFEKVPVVNVLRGCRELVDSHLKEAQGYSEWILSFKPAGR